MGWNCLRVTEPPPHRLVVGVTGASGAVYGVRVLDACRDLGVETHLIVSRAAALTLAQETDLTLADLAAKAAVIAQGRRRRRQRWPPAPTAPWA